MLGWFRSLMPREDSFFALFDAHSRTLVAGAEALSRLLEGGDAVTINGREIVEQEAKADEVTRQVLEAIRKSFITPFDRQDIQDLIQSMDDAIDEMHKTVKTITLYGVRDFDPVMREMGACVVKAAELTAQAVPLLSAIGTNAAQLSELTEAITKQEGHSDELQEQGLRALYQAKGHDDPMAYMIGREIYDGLEKVVDRFEDVANEISGIVIENV